MVKCNLHKSIESDPIDITASFGAGKKSRQHYGAINQNYNGERLSIMNLLKFIQEDAKAYNLSNNPVTTANLIKLYIRAVKWRIVVKMRISQHCFQLGGGWRKLSWYLYGVNLRTGVDIHPAAKIGPGLRLAHPIAVVIGENAVIGKFVRIQQSVTIGGNSGKTSNEFDHVRTMPEISDYAMLGPGACIIGPIKIGKGAVVGANSVVTKNVNDWSVVSGIPAKELNIIEDGTLYMYHYREMLPRTEFK